MSIEDMMCTARFDESFTNHKMRAKKQEEKHLFRADGSEKREKREKAGARSEKRVDD